MAPAARGRNGLDELLHLLFADGADDRVLDAALGDDHEGGDALNAELLCDDGRLVDVHLEHPDLALHLAGEGLDFGGDRLAGLAPIGRELQEDGELAAQDFAFEVALGDVGDGAACPSLALALGRSVAARTPAAEPAENGHRLGDLTPCASTVEVVQLG